MRKINRHIVHCSASTHGDVAEIRRWHVARGWQDVGYHFVIRPDGEVEVGRMLTEMGAHCEGHNADSVGTCLVGNTTFTPAQFKALRRLHAALGLMFPGLQVFGHRDFNPHKTCPNFDVQAMLRQPKD
jgi:N-acetyl-anhydromuramyl-L-alanine amidase AmpD